MYLMQTKELDFINPIKTDDLTYGKAVVDAMVKELIDYGFTDQVSGRDHILCWNGKPRFELQEKANTDGLISFRFALPYADNSDTWGITASAGSVTSIANDSKNVRLQIKIWYFASEDVVYFGFADTIYSTPNHYIISIPCKTVEGVETIVGIRNFNNETPSIIPYVEATISNDYPFSWNISYTDFGTGKPDECYIRQGCVLYQSKIVKYIVDDFAEIKALNDFVLGQVITVDGERYVNVGSYDYFVKLTPIT